MANTIQIKRHTSYGTDADPAATGGLAYGELAWTNEGKKLWIGRQTGDGPDVITSYHLNPDASTTVKGLASFDTNNFAVTNGAVSISAVGATLLTGTINNARLSNIPSSALAGSIANSKLANSTIAINSQTASLGGGFTIQGTNDEVDVGTSGTTVTVGLPNDVTIGNDLIVTGDLTVNGDTVTANVSTITVEDKTIEVGKAASPSNATANGSGLIVTGADEKSIKYASSGDQWEINKPLSVTGAVSATGGNSGNWNTAYTHSQSAHAPTNADQTNATNVAAAGAVMDGDFSSNGILKRTGAGTYGIVTDASANWNAAYTHSQATHAPTNADNTAANETSHADVVVDGDFSANGILTRTSAGNYSAITDNSSNWNTAYTDRFKWDGSSTGLTASTGRTSLGLNASWVQSLHASYDSIDVDTSGVTVIDELTVNNTGHVTAATTRDLSLADFGTIDGGTVNWS